MDKYEYNIKLDEIKALVGKQDYTGAAGICDTIEWRKVRSNNTLNMVADVYEATRQYDKAKNALLIAYERTPLGRQLAYRLTILSIKEKNFEEAEEFYEDFLEVSPRDPARYLLEYQLAKAKGTDIDVLIGILEEYSQEDVDERWLYELTVLYHRAGYRDKCIALCDEMILWFGDGKYVEKALELKMLYEPLTQSQQEKYDKHWERRTHQTSREMAPSENVSEQSESTEEQQAATLHTQPAEADDTVMPESYVQEDMVQPLAGDTIQESVPSVTKVDTMQESVPSVTKVDITQEEVTSGVVETQTTLLDDGVKKSGETEYSIKANGSIVGRVSGSGDVSDVVPATMLREKLEAQEREISQREAEEAKKSQKHQRVNAVAKAEVIFEEMKQVEEQSAAITQESDIDEIQEEGIETPAQESVTEDKETANSEEVSEEDVFTEDEEEAPQEEVTEEIEEPGEDESTEDEEETPQEEAAEEVEEPEEDESTEDEEETSQEEVGKEAEEPEEGIFTENAIGTQPEEKQAESAKEQELLEGSTGELVMSLGDKIQNNTMQDEYNRVNLQEEIAKSMASILGNLQLDNENEEEIQELQVAATKRIPDVPQESGGDTKRISDISQMKGMFQPVNAMSEPKPEDEQIEGQLSLEDVMAQFENTSQESDTEEKEEPISYFTRPIFGEEFTEGIKEALGENSSLQDELMQDMEGAEALQEQSQNMVTDKYLEQMEPTAQIQEEEEYQAPVFNVQSFRDMEQPSQEMQTLQEEQVTGQATQEEMEASDALITPEAPIIPEQTTVPEASIIPEQTTVPENFPPENGLSRKELLESAENAFEDWYDKGKAPVAATAEEPKEPVKVEMEHHTDPAFEKMRQKKEEKKNKGRKRIPESKRAAFASFLEIKDLEEQIATTLENLAYHSSNDGTSSTNNVLIAGETKSGKTTLALELIKTSNKDRSRTGRKVAKVKGSTLNKRGIKNVMAKLLGTDLIIEQAGSLMPQQVSELIETLSGFTGNMLVILEDDKVALDRLVELHPQLGVMFSNQIVIKGYDINEWVRIAKEYAKSQDYGVDEMGTLALYAKINDVYGKKKEVEKKDVQMIIDDAIKHSEKKNIGKIFEIVFSRKYKDSDLTMLRESDFQ